MSSIIHKEILELLKSVPEEVRLTLIGCWTFHAWKCSIYFLPGMYLDRSLPVFTAYIFLNTSRASSFLPFSSRKRGLSGNPNIATEARNSGNEHTARNTLHELISIVSLVRVTVHFWGKISHAIPRKIIIFSVFYNSVH